MSLFYSLARFKSCMLISNRYSAALQSNACMSIVLSLLTISGILLWGETLVIVQKELSLSWHVILQRPQGAKQVIMIQTRMVPAG